MWKAIDNFNRYEVNELGEVRNSKTGRVLKPFVTKQGYNRVCLYNDCEKKYCYVHRLVLETFLPFEGMEKYQVNHKDEIKTNNNIDNLEWCDCKYNSNYGTKPYRNSINNPLTKPINQYDKDLNYIQTFTNGREAAIRFGISQSQIRNAATYQQNHRTAGGFRWRYVEDTIDGIEPKDKTY